MKPVSFMSHLLSPQEGMCLSGGNSYTAPGLQTGDSCRQVRRVDLWVRGGEQDEDVGSRRPSHPRCLPYSQVTIHPFGDGLDKTAASRLFINSQDSNLWTPMFNKVCAATLGLCLLLRDIPGPSARAPLPLSLLSSSQCKQSQVLCCFSTRAFYTFPCRHPFFCSS